LRSNAMMLRHCLKNSNSFRCFLYLCIDAWSKFFLRYACNPCHFKLMTHWLYSQSQRAAAINEVLKSRQNGLFVFDIIADPDGNDLEEEVLHVVWPLFVAPPYFWEPGRLVSGVCIRTMCLLWTVVCRKNRPNGSTEGKGSYYAAHCSSVCKWSRFLQVPLQFREYKEQLTKSGIQN